MWGCLFSHNNRTHQGSSTAIACLDAVVPGNVASGGRESHAFEPAPAPTWNIESQGNVMGFAAGVQRLDWYGIKQYGPEDAFHDFDGRGRRHEASLRCAIAQYHLLWLRFNLQERWLL